MIDLSVNLSSDEKEVFVETIAQLVKTDAVLDDSEKKFLKEVIAIYHVDYAKILSEVKTQAQYMNKIRQTITSRSKALLLIKELLTVANIDNDLAKEEVDFIEKVASVLNIEKEKVVQINQLVLNRKLWLQQYAEIMEDIS